MLISKFKKMFSTLLLYPAVMHKLFLRPLLNEADFLVFWLSSNDRRLDEKLIVFNVISVSFSATNRPKNMSAASVQKVTNETAHIRNHENNCLMLLQMSN
jgi:hypothetical protein